MILFLNRLFSASFKGSFHCPEKIPSILIYEIHSPQSICLCFAFCWCRDETARLGHRFLKGIEMQGTLRENLLYPDFAAEMCVKAYSNDWVSTLNHYRKIRNQLLFIRRLRFASLVNFNFQFLEEIFIIMKSLLKRRYAGQGRVIYRLMGVI